MNRICSVSNWLKKSSGWGLFLLGGVVGSSGFVAFLDTAFLNQAVADDFHYRSVLVGERGASLGGAFLAISDDPSGVFYNPAGIVFGFENYISGSANTYTSSKTVY